MNQYNDWSRQWGEGGGGGSRLERLKIDLTSTDDDGGVRRGKKKTSFPRKEEGRSAVCLQGVFVRLLGLCT